MMIKTVTDYLEQTVRRLPDKIAFADDIRAITFAELRREARGVGQTLADRGLFRRPVAVYMDKCVEYISAMLGVTYSGNFYTALDAHMPVARIRKIMDTLEPAVILTDEAHEEAARGFAGDAEVLLYAGASAAEPSDEVLAEVRGRILRTDIMFVLFTSGSTGVPKGVTMLHGAAIPYAEWGSEKFSLDEQTVFAQQVPLYFVASCFEIFHTLRNGCTTYLVSREAFSFPTLLMSFLQEKKINFVVLVPSVMCMVANFDALEEPRAEYLRTVIFGGEAMPGKQMNQWRRAYPDVDFYNIYGLTETLDDSIYFYVDREMDETEPMPIGRSCEHMDFFLADDDGRRIPLSEAGTIGEICARGPSLAAGYYKDPAATARVFVQDPDNDAYPDVVFHTGDLARYNDRGEIVYICRKDFQIKHMGNRIELGEIEAAASALSGVERCCCLHDGERDLIVLFYAGEAGTEAVLPALRRALPDYMVPNRLSRMEELPLNFNGKVDRAKLKEML